MVWATTIEYLFIFFSCISGMLSFSVLMTAFVFPQMRSKVFMQIIIMLSLSDLIASVGSAFGFPPNSSLLCPTQSILTTYFYHASWFWSVALNYQLYSVVTTTRLGMSSGFMHAICWILSLLCTFLPLSAGATFGRDIDDTTGALGWCYLKTNNFNNYLIVWIPLSVLPLFLSIFVMCYFSTRIFFQFRKNPTVFGVVDMLFWYPIAMIINWLPNIIVAFLINTNIISYDNLTIVMIANGLTILATQNGTFSAMIFFWKSREARYRWANLLGINSTSQEMSPVDFENDEKISLSNKLDDGQGTSTEESETHYMRYTDEEPGGISITSRASFQMGPRRSSIEGGDSFSGWSTLAEVNNSLFACKDANHESSLSAL